MPIAANASPSADPSFASDPIAFNPSIKTNFHPLSGDCATYWSDRHSNGIVSYLVMFARSG